jgi:hypothetical protein
VGLFDNLFKNKPTPADEEVVEAARRITETEKARLVEAEKAASAAGPKAPASGNRAAHAPVARAYSPRSLGQAVPPRAVTGGKGTARPARFGGGGEGARPQEIRLLLDDVLPRIPPDYLNDGPRDGRKEIRFRVEDVTADIARGRAAVALSRIAEQVPEIFRAPIAVNDETLIRLPLQKLVEQIGFLPVKPGSEPKLARTPPLGLSSSATPPLASVPSVFKQDGPQTFQPGRNDLVSEPQDSAAVAKSSAFAPAEESEPESVTFEIRHERMSEGGLSTKDEAAASSASQAPEPEPTVAAPDYQSGMGGDAKIALSLAAVLRECPQEMICAPLPPISADEMISVAFAPIEKQLHSGQVEISSVRFVFALPPHLQHCFEAREGIRIPLPINEILRNLPEGVEIPTNLAAGSAVHPIESRVEPVSNAAPADPDASPELKPTVPSEAPSPDVPASVRDSLVGDRLSGEEDTADSGIETARAEATIVDSGFEAALPPQAISSLYANDPGGGPDAGTADSFSREQSSGLPPGEPAPEAQVLSPESTAEANFSVEAPASAAAPMSFSAKYAGTPIDDAERSVTLTSRPIPAPPFIASILPPPILGDVTRSQDRPSISFSGSENPPPEAKSAATELSFQQRYLTPPIQLTPPPAVGESHAGGPSGPAQENERIPAVGRDSAASPFIAPPVVPVPPPVLSAAAMTKEVSSYVDPPPSPILPVRLVSPPVLRPVVAPPPLFGVGLGEDESVPEPAAPIAVEEIAPPPPPPPAPLLLAKAHTALNLPADADLSTIGHALTRLPGLCGCLLTVRHESADCGEIPETLDRVAARELASRLAQSLAGARIGQVQHATIFMAEGCLSVFARGNALLCALHQTRAFLPGVCEKLSTAAEALSEA